MSESPSWHFTGEWFDNCSCAVACPCTFAQTPDNANQFCSGTSAMAIMGDIKLDGLGFVRVDQPTIT